MAAAMTDLAPILPDVPMFVDLRGPGHPSATRIFRLRLVRGRAHAGYVHLRLTGRTPDAAMIDGILPEGCSCISIIDASDHALAAGMPLAVDDLGVGQVSYPGGDFGGGATRSEIAA